MVNAMKSVCYLFVLIISFIVFPSSAVYSFEGPLQVKNQYPIFLHADEQYLEKAAMESSLSFSLSHSSTYTVQSSGRWIIDLDMEITELNLRYKGIVNNFVELNIDVPVLALSAGFLDGFLESYHNAFGFSDYGRSDRPKNDFLYEVREDGELIVKGKTGIGIGDVRLALKKPLISSNGFNLSVKADVELPSGKAKTGYGSGNVDAGVSILIDKSISSAVMTYWNFGAVFPGDVKGYRKLNLKNYFHGGAGLEAALGKRFSLLAQVQGQSSIYPKTDLLAVDRAAFLLTFGGRYSSGKSSAELSLAEDINAAGTPDFTVNLSYKIKL